MNVFLLVVTLPSSLLAWRVVNTASVAIIQNLLLYNFHHNDSAVITLHCNSFTLLLSLERNMVYHKR